MRSELELWEILRDNLINFWTTDPRQNKGYRAMSVWGVVIVMGFRDIDLYSYQERDFILERFKQISIQDGQKKYYRYYETGKIEPVLETIKQQIKTLQDAKL